MKHAVTKGMIMFVLLGLWGLGLSGCAAWGTYNPATDRREFIVIPTTSEVHMGQQMHRQMREQYTIVSDGPLARRIERLGERVARVSDRQDYEYFFYLIDAEEMNAFTVPGGRIYMFSALAKLLETDDKIAAVLAHEVGHCAARHSVKKFQAAMAYDVVSGILFNQLGMEAQVEQILSLTTEAVTTLAFSAYSRRDEYEADALGLKYAVAAGFDPRGLVEALEDIQAQAQGPKIPLFLRTHPYVHDRINILEDKIR